ncbi:MAG TPA: hypothetical protein VIJ75_12500 [Hanamia sp.]
MATTTNRGQEVILKNLWELEKKWGKKLIEVQKLIAATGIPRPDKWLAISIEENGRITTLMDVGGVLKELNQSDIII